MTPLHTLDKVIDLAQRRRDEALAAQARLQQELHQAQEQMDQLQTYAQEAQQRWAARSAAGVDAQLLMHHRQFMHKIEHAIEFQNGVLGDRQARTGQAQAAVIDAERELASLRKYIERQQSALRQRVQRREQKSTDETAQNVHRRRAEVDSSFQTTP